jgi:hypothetical protein
MKCDSCSQEHYPLFSMEKSDGKFCSGCMHSLGLEAIERLNEAASAASVDYARFTKALEEIAETVVSVKHEAGNYERSEKFTDFEK